MNSAKEKRQKRYAPAVHLSLEVFCVSDDHWFDHRSDEILILNALLLLAIPEEMSERTNRAQDRC